MDELEMKEKIDLIITEIKAYDDLHKLGWVVSLRERVDYELSQLSDYYLKIINSKELFSDFKKENIKEIVSYRKIIQEELSLIKKINDKLRAELSNGVFAKLISIFKDMELIKDSIKTDI